MGALYKGFIVSAVLALIGIYGIIEIFVGMDASFTSSNGNFTALIYFIVLL